MKAVNKYIKFAGAIIILGLVFPANLSSLNEPGKSFEEIFILIYKQEFKEARLELDRSKDKLDKWEAQVLDLDLLFWKAISTDRQDDFDNLETGLRTYSSAVRKGDATDQLSELISLSYSFRLQAIKGRFIAMMTDFFRINHLVQHFDTAALDQEQKEVYNIYLALYNIGKSKLLFNNQKVKEESIRILEDCLNSSNPVYQTSAQYFLSKIYLEVDKSPADARVYCEQLCSSYPTNKIFIHNLALCSDPEL